MNSINTLPKTSYLPVPWECKETINDSIDKKENGKIFFFNNDEQVDEEKGQIIEMKEEKNAGVFITLDTGAKIRIDRIITLFGKIGAAYDEYDAYANACMSCLGGYEQDEL